MWNSPEKTYLPKFKKINIDGGNCVYAFFSFDFLFEKSSILTTEYIQSERNIIRL